MLPPSSCRCRWCPVHLGEDHLRHLRSQDRRHQEFYTLVLLCDISGALLRHCQGLCRHFQVETTVETALLQRNAVVSPIFSSIRLVHKRTSDSSIRQFEFAIFASCSAAYSQIQQYAPLSVTRSISSSRDCRGIPGRRARRGSLTPQFSLLQIDILHSYTFSNLQSVTITS